MHADSSGHSELTTHSGRQFGGVPIMCGSQLHTHRSPTTRGGNEKLPHGFGSQGSTSIGSIAKEIKLVGLAKQK